MPIDRQGLKALHAALQRGEGVVILPDQVPKTIGAAGWWRCSSVIRR